MHRVLNLPPGHPEGQPRSGHGRAAIQGTWETLGSTRRPLIWVNGESVAEVDYSVLFARLAYLQVAQVPPAHDLYRTVAGIVT